MIVSHREIQHKIDRVMLIFAFQTMFDQEYLDGFFTYLASDLNINKDVLQAKFKTYQDELIVSESYIYISHSGSFCEHGYGLFSGYCKVLPARWEKIKTFMKNNTDEESLKIAIFHGYDDAPICYVNVDLKKVFLSCVEEDDRYGPVAECLINNRFIDLIEGIMNNVGSDALKRILLELR